MVLEVPPAIDKTVFFGSAIDSWQVPLADIGGTGDDAGKGGKYLFLPPGYDGKPPDGYFVVPSETVFIHIALRPITVGKGTLADAVAYSQLVEGVSAGGRREADALRRRLPEGLEDAADLRRELLPASSPRRSRSSRRKPKDAAMLAMLASIGIEKGKPFQPDATRAKLLTAAVREAEATMNDGFMNHAFEPFWPDRQWLATKPENNFAYSYYGNGMLDYDRRAAAFAYWATWAPKRLGDPKKLPASYYLKSFRDSTGHCSAATNPIACACRPTRRRTTSGRSSPTKSAPTPSSTTRRIVSACRRTTSSRWPSIRTAPWTSTSGRRRRTA